MSINEALARLRGEALGRGEFLVSATDSVDEVVVREHVSKGYGVYVISGCRNAKREILYIGKAGTVCQDGSMKKQGLRQRLTMKQDGIYRREYFRQKITDMKLDALHIEWFVTYSAGSGVPPFLAESALLAAFLCASGQLPSWNKSA